MLIGGDSGSKAVTTDTPYGITALGYAGSDSLSLWNRIDYVLESTPPTIVSDPEKILRELLGLGVLVAPLLLTAM